MPLLTAAELLAKFRSPVEELEIELNRLLARKTLLCDEHGVISEQLARLGEKVDDTVRRLTIARSDEPAADEPRSPEPDDDAERGDAERGDA